MVRPTEFSVEAHGQCPSLRPPSAEGGFFAKIPLTAICCGGGCLSAFLSFPVGWLLVLRLWGNYNHTPGGQFRVLITS